MAPPRDLGKSLGNYHWESRGYPFGMPQGVCLWMADFTMGRRPEPREIPQDKPRISGAGTAGWAWHGAGVPQGDWLRKTSTLFLTGGTQAIPSMARRRNPGRAHGNICEYSHPRASIGWSGLGGYPPVKPSWVELLTYPMGASPCIR
jgi:hypothetical protein